VDNTNQKAGGYFGGKAAKQNPKPKKKPLEKQAPEPESDFDSEDDQMPLEKQKGSSKSSSSSQSNKQGAQSVVREPPRLGLRESLFAGFSNDTQRTSGKKKGALKGLAPLEIDDAEDSYLYPAMSSGFETLGGVESDEDEEDASRGAKRRAPGQSEGAKGGSRRWGARQLDEQREARELDKEWGQIQKILKEKDGKKPKKESAKRQRILKGFARK